MDYARPVNVPIQIADDHEAMSRQAAHRLMEALSARPNLLLCAAGGSTPVRAYECLAQSHKQKAEVFSSLRILKLDEWGGLEMDDPASCETQLRRQLINPLGVEEKRVFSFKSNAKDPAAECQRLQRLLNKEGPIDLCLLGLGLNGHLGMNEPAPALQLRSHVAQLTEVSLRHPMLARARSVPTFGLTLGIGEILASRQILLLVSGAAKRGALQRLLRQEISPEFPASFLWLHPNCTLLCDRAAAGEGLSGGAS